MRVSASNGFVKHPLRPRFPKPEAKGRQGYYLDIAGTNQRIKVVIQEKENHSAWLVCP